MNSPKRTARLAGLLYLLGGLTGPFTLFYIPSVLIVPGNAPATASKIRAFELLLRAGIVSDLACSIIFIFVVLNLYRLLKDVDHFHAVLMVIMWLMSVPIAFMNTLNSLAALILVSGADFLSVFTQGQKDAMAMMFLRLHSHGNIVNSIFWGLWLLPLGCLVFKSGLFPRILGVFLIIASVGYVIGSVTYLLLPHYGLIVSRFVMIAEGLGEVPFVFWLLAKGVTISPPKTQAEAS